MKENIAAVVVHHRSYETIADTVKILLQEGIDADSLIVVDNSEEPDRRSALVDSLPYGMTVLFGENKGYGAAVNSALDYFSGRQEKPEYFLVATHETKPRPGAIDELLNAISDPEIAVAGPTLLSGRTPEFIWSAGGFLSSGLRVPAHHHHRDKPQVLRGLNSAQDREWLDGAFLLYRWSDIVRQRFDESFFLYMEETDLHLRLLRQGRRVVWVPRAQVWQDSKGIPPYYLARNLRLLFRKHERTSWRLAVVPYIVAKRVAGDILRRRDFSSALPSIRGLTVHLPEREPESRSLTIVNPLGAALKHYETEVTSVLSGEERIRRAGKILEPSASGRSPLSWILAYISVLVGARKSAYSERLLILWPVLGFLDVVILRVLGIQNACLVMHDPRPLVKGVGYSRFSRFLASKFLGSTTIAAHSAKAAQVLAHDAPGMKVVLLPHPIIEPRAMMPSKKKTIAEIRVLGQYKKDRDLEALHSIGAQLGMNAHLEIQGRGWPNVPGWRVVEGFVPEEQLEKKFLRSDAIVIPYKNFYQSGIAIRALENGVPFVGPKDSVLAEILGHGSELLVDGNNSNGWLDALHHATTEDGRREAIYAAARWRARAVKEWTDWYKTT